MRSPHQRILLVLLATLFRPNDGLEISTKSSDITGSMKDLLLREGDKLTRATRLEHNENRTSIPSNPSENLGQIINLLNCGPFQLSPNSHLQYSLDYTTKNYVLLQECDRYFKMIPKNESLQVQCKYKNWIFNKIECDKITCPHLTALPGGHFSTNENTYNTTVYFWCSPGFSINGTDTLFCEESGLWNLPPPTCNIAYCQPLPSPRNGFISNPKEIATNKTVVFRCKGEYVLIGDAVLRCQDDGRWNTTVPVCKKMCTVPNITSQYDIVRSIPELKKLPIGSLLYQGQRVIFSCKPGYAMLQSGISTCLEGTWIPPISCRKTCDAAEIENGRYILSKDASHIVYFCHPGYKLIGKQRLSCTHNQIWDGQRPTCTKLCTLPKRKNVASFRQEGTFEIIPFGSQIVNATQVHTICRSGAPPSHINVTECVNGELRPIPCKDPRSRLESGFLKVLHQGNWFNVCEMTDDVCDAFGYNKGTYWACSPCYQLDLDDFRGNKITLARLRRRKKCVRCTD